MTVPGSLSNRPDAAGFIRHWRYVPSGAPRRFGARWLLQRTLKTAVWAYLRVFHDFEVRYDPGIPRGRPYIAVINHTSALDVPALMAADPYDPPTAMVIKREMMAVPLLGTLLRLWGAIPVARMGRDVAALRQIKEVLAGGGGICVAPAGTRSTDGRLGPVNPVLARLILQSDAAVFPVAIVGTFECLPKGAKVPKPGKVYIDSGPEIDLKPFRGHRLSEEELVEAARAIRDAIAALLPAYMRPAASTPVLGAYRVVSDLPQAP